MVQDTRLNPWSPDLWSAPKEYFSVSLPKITLGILNYNRVEDLRRTLDCLTKAVQYPDLEIIVVDNASVDNSVEMMRNEFPEVKIITLVTNIGTSGRNHFYSHAKGKYVFSFDDDSFPASPSAIFRAVTLLEKAVDIDSLTFLCYQPLSGVTETGNSEEVYFSGIQKKSTRGIPFAEGAMCIRTSAWKKIKGYDTDFFWGAEGLDLTLQMYKEGMSAIYHPGLAVLHMKSPENRNIGKNHYYFTRNQVWAISKHFPIYITLPVIFLFIIRKIIGIFLHPNFLLPYSKGLVDGIISIPSQRKKCKKLSLRQVLGLKRWYLMLFRY